MNPRTVRTPRLDVDFSDPAIIADPFPVYEQVRATGRVERVSDAESDAYWDRMNQDIADASKAMAWDDVTTGAAAGRERVRTALAELGEIDGVAGTWFAEETYVHYDEHAEHITAFADGLPA